MGRKNDCFSGVKTRTIESAGFPNLRSQLVASIQQTWLIPNEYRIKLGDGGFTAGLRQAEG
ncbi:MAG: hypothetical protein DME69_05305 [Verrucomicrobia bacterium]|nr:MAG: hypothetical protein DME87_12680 [Verrucomicrobiota bacterium]PYJ79288.1 MAG: hypothetical protein DME69_05305 [Verrucomicrobiota bacterium]